MAVVVMAVVVLKVKATSNVVKAVMIVHVVASMTNHVANVQHLVAKSVHVVNLAVVAIVVVDTAAAKDAAVAAAVVAIVIKKYPNLR